MLNDNFQSCLMLWGSLLQERPTEVTSHHRSRLILQQHPATKQPASPSPFLSSPLKGRLVDAYVGAQEVLPSLAWLTFESFEDDVNVYHREFTLRMVWSVGGAEEMIGCARMEGNYHQLSGATVQMFLWRLFRFFSFACSVGPCVCK